MREIWVRDNLLVSLRQQGHHSADMRLGFFPEEEREWRKMSECKVLAPPPFFDGINGRWKWLKCSLAVGNPVVRAKAKHYGSVIKRHFRRCLTKPRSRQFSVLPSVTYKHCLLLTVIRRLASQTRKLFRNKPLIN